MLSLAADFQIARTFSSSVHTVHTVYSYRARLPSKIDPFRAAAASRTSQERAADQALV